MLHDTLVSLHTHMSNPENWARYGLCMSIDMESSDPSTLLEARRLMRKWPKYSGDPSFPLPGRQSAYEEKSLDEDRRAYMWDRTNSPYAALRWELLEWMIHETEIELVAPVVPD